MTLKIENLPERRLWMPTLVTTIIFVELLTTLVPATAIGTDTLQPSQQTPNIQAPLLTQSVRLDGRLSGTEEWSDVPGTSLSISCGNKLCSQAGYRSIRNVQAIVWIKHDGKWLYFLYRVDWPKANLTTHDEATIRYSWNTGGENAGIPVNGKWLYVDELFVGGGYDEDKKVVNPTWVYTSDVFGYRDDTEWSPPGRNDVQGIATYDGEHYWYEFRKPLNSGDGRDWNFTVGRTYGVLGSDGLLEVGFGTSNPRIRYYQPITLTLLDTRTIRTTVTTASSTSLWLTSASSTSATARSSTGTTTTATGALPMILALMPFGALGWIGLLAVMAVVSSVVVFSRRRQAVAQLVTLKEENAQDEPVHTKSTTSYKTNISTGYADLDETLAGGIPEGYAVVLVSPSYDERDLLLRKIIDSALSSGRPAFYISNDIERTHDLLARYQQGFHAFSPQADKITSDAVNLYKIPGIENLSEANISLALAIKEARAKEKATKMVLIIDILSDLLLRYKSITTRRWLSDFIGKRKVEGFTTLATLNPLTGSKEESQTVIDFFDGVIEIFERELKERSRRFVIVKKMYGKKYSESELMLDKDKLF